MVLNGDNIVSLANYLGISEQSFRNKMRENGTSFKQGEIAMIVARYKLTPDETMTIFLLTLCLNQTQQDKIKAERKPPSETGR